MNLSDDTKIRETYEWIVESALLGRPHEETIRSFAQRLNDFGIPVQRLNCSALQRHSIMGAVDWTWDEDSGKCETVFVTRSTLIRSEQAKTPVGALARSGSNFERYRLEDPDARSKFAILERLRAHGFRDYIVLKQTFGRKYDWLDFDEDSEAAYGSLATRNTSGFSAEQIDVIKHLWVPFSLFLRASSERMLSAKLLEAYVGSLAAQSILSGQIERGDGDKINCVLWYSDLRGSTRLSTKLPANEYLELLNLYFDCTAGSVMEHAGEVLKLVGDGVMAVFPFDPGEEVKACSAALSAARDSLSKAKKLQQENTVAAASELYFGVGLHIGEVILGNIGTLERLDMTVTGRAANQVTRVEALTKALSLSVLASPQFYQSHQGGLVSVGKYPVPDLGGMTEIFSLVER